MRVLFVDDEERVLAGIERTVFMADRDWDVAFAASGAEALTKLASQPADVVVSDMRMPLMDGAELLRRVRDTWPSAIRIILSGRPLRRYRDVEPGTAQRGQALFHALLDAGVLVNANGLGCLSTPMGEPEVEEIASALDRALRALRSR